MLHTRKELTQIFDSVGCPILCSSKLQCCCGPEPYMWLWHGLMSDILKKSRLNWELKVSNLADKAIIQSQACDTRYLRMQELNSLCQ